MAELLILGRFSPNPLKATDQGFACSQFIRRGAPPPLHSQRASQQPALLGGSPRGSPQNRLSPFEKSGEQHNHIFIMPKDFYFGSVGKLANFRPNSLGILNESKSEEIS